MASYVKQISFLLVCSYVFSQSVSNETNEVSCVCVWDFLCVNGTLDDEYSEKVLTPRSSNPNCNEDLGLMLCCTYGGTLQPEISSSLDEESTTPPSRKNETDFEGDEAPKQTNQLLFNPTLSGLDDSLDFIGPVPNRPFLNGSVLHGHIPSGSVTSGSVSSGSVPSGPVPSGSVQNGSVKGGSFPSKPLPNVFFPSRPTSSRPSSSGYSSKSFPSNFFQNALFPGAPILSTGMYFPIANGNSANAPYPSTPYPNAPYPGTPYQHAPYQHAPYQHSPHQQPHYQYEPFPKKTVTLLAESSGSKGPDPSGRPNQNAANVFVLNEDGPRPKANAFFVPKPGCGVKRTELKQRVSFTSIDESVSIFAEFPWMLAVFTYYNSTSWKYQCGASLIHKHVAFTAAHCVDRFPITSLRIRAGEWNTKTAEEPDRHQDRKVNRVELHQRYSRSDLRHDIALIFLETPFNTTRSVDTICLPGPDAVFDNIKCTVTGWGKDAKNLTIKHHDILHKVEVPIVPREECERRLSQTTGKPIIVHDSFLCAGGEVGKDACKGDGGGPLICPTDEENRWVQAGIVSSGYGCGTNNPAFYTDVSYHFDWIDRALREIEHIPTDPHGSSNIPNVYQPRRLPVTIF